jgi:AraC-like DNA-binding protein/ligand-binding sensor protein
MNIATSERNRQVAEKIEATSLYQSYAKAFQEVTGLPLMLQPMHGDVMKSSCKQSAFCRQLNASQACRDCQCLHNSLMRNATEHAATEQCGMGLTETAVPVRFGNETIALLKTGQVRHEKPGKTDLQALAEHLREQGVQDEEIERLAEAYSKITVMDGDTYEHTVTMLAIFSLHVTTLINQLILAQSEEEQPVVTAAKRFIREHLDEKLTLEAIAEAVQVSPFYFCKVFKLATGMTFTEYVNRKRVEWAKQELLKPSATVTEVAFEVGYQSLSQFNRSFLRYAGEAPTKFRKRMSEGAATAQKAA